MSDIRRNGRDRTTEALDEYLRALGQAARDQAVAQAEEEVCRVWSEELAHVRQVTQAAVISAGAAYEAAMTLVNEHQRSGDLSALTRAQRQLEQAREHERRNSEAAETLLGAIAEEMDLLAVAAEERETVALANRIWVSSASRAVYAAGSHAGGSHGGTGARRPPREGPR